jgi:riboflavin synthase
VDLPAPSAKRAIDQDGCDQIVELGIVLLAVLGYGTRPACHALVLGREAVRFGPS